MSLLVASATESKVTIEGEEIVGLQSLDFKVVRQQIDVTGIGQGNLLGVAEAGMFKVNGTLRVRSLNKKLDGLLYMPIPTPFSLVATLMRGGQQIKKIAFEECYLGDKSYEMETGGVGLTVYNFTAKAVREE